MVPPEPPKRLLNFVVEVFCEIACRVLHAQDGTGRHTAESEMRGAGLHTLMNGFKLWLLVLESGRFDHAGFNALFRRQLAELLPRVTDHRRRMSLAALQDFDFVAYILATLRNAGIGDQREREEAAHDVVVQLLVSPGQLVAGYADTSGPMEARFRIAVQNAVRNLLRTKRRHPSAKAISIGRNAGAFPAEAIPDRHLDDDEMLDAFRSFLRKEVGEDAVRLLDRRLDGMSLRQVARDHRLGLSGWRLRRLMRRVREAALAFARRHGNDEFLTAIERLAAG